MKKVILCLILVLSLVSNAQIITLSDLPGGAYPKGDLVTDGSYLYGMTQTDGFGGGTIFKVKNDGTAYTVLLNFNGANGYIPTGSLLIDGNDLYGMTSQGGAYGCGNIFKIQTDGTGFVTLYDFSYWDGANPSGSLISDGTYLYGMTNQGGASGSGNIFKIQTNGSNYQSLMDFYGYNGYCPYGSLVSDGTYLYGMTSQGGFGYGNIFKIQTDGSNYQNLLNFDGSSGYYPYGSLISDGTYLYGMTSQGGFGYGNIFKVQTDGSDFTNLLSFSGLDGYYPNGSLVSDGTYLYGMTLYGGANGLGNMFKIQPDGSNFSNLADFNGTNGYYPYGSLIIDGSGLYGMANQGGAVGGGTIVKYCQGSSINISASGLVIGPTITLTASGAVSYTWSTSQTTSSISVTPTVATTYSVSGITVCGNSTATVHISGPGSALNFDGNDIVSMPASASINNLGPAGFTLESWVYTNSAGLYSIIRKSGDYNLYINGDKIAAEVWPLGNPNPSWKMFKATSSLPANIWTHVAFTWDGVSGLLYVNGTAVTTTSATASIGSSENLNLGASAVYGNYLYGSIDEVRIWNAVRTPCQINTFKNCEIPTSATGLVANYHFNQGFGNSNNFSATTLTDASGYNNHGSLSGFALTGLTSNWIDEGAVANGFTTTTSPTVCIGSLPIELLNFDAVCVNNSMVLNWCTATEKINDYFTIEQSVNGADFKAIAKVYGNGTTEKKHCYQVTAESLADVNYFKLTQTDYNGTKKSFDMISINSCTKKQGDIVLANDGNKTIGVILNSESSQKLQLFVYNTMGLLVEVQTVNIEEGSNNIRVRLNNTSVGLYDISIYNEQEKLISKKIAITDSEN